MENGAWAATDSPTALTPSPKLQLPSSCIPPSLQKSHQWRVWVIFGATGHIGRSLVKAALAHNDRVTAVGRAFHDNLRDIQELEAAATSPTKDTAEDSPKSSLLPLLCDVRVRETVDSIFKKSLEHWGTIDIIGNCSGYGIIGACEDQDDFEIRDQFEANFWGTLNIVQLSLPFFRKQKQGRYIVFSSTSGALGVPGLGPYCASKYAVEGLIESMLYETAAFNVRATLVEPGHVRRDDPPTSLHSDAKKANVLPKFGHFSIKAPTEPYDNPIAPAGHAKRTLQWMGDKQPTSAIKAAELVWQLGHCAYPPLRLLLGGFAVESIRDRLRSITEEIEDWKFLSFKNEDDQRDEETKTQIEKDEKEDAEEDMEMEMDEEDPDIDGRVDEEDIE